MLKSMTGYGEAEGDLKGTAYAVEIRAVNNRFFKSRVNLPESVSFLEEEIVKLLRKELSRGMITYTVRVRGTFRSSMYQIDERALKSYMEALKKAALSAEFGGAIDIGSLVGLPGVLVPIPPDEDTISGIRDLILDISKQALSRLGEMQIAEGSALADDLTNHCEAIKSELKHILELRDVTLQEYSRKLKERVDKLLSGKQVEIDETTLAREVALFAERSDISEEITRLQSHLEQFEENCQADEQSGRRLDFLTQEMLREANTIASKSSDWRITHSVVDIKCRIEQIREQVQNVK